MSNTLQHQFTNKDLDYKYLLEEKQWQHVSLCERKYRRLLLPLRLKTGANKNTMRLKKKNDFKKQYPSKSKITYPRNDSSVSQFHTQLKLKKLIT